LAAESPAEISQLQIRQPSALARQGSKSPICAALGKVQQFRCYRSGPRRLLGEYGGIEADQQQQEAADSNSWLWLASSSSRLIE
jgi:hypothetical protein